MTKNTKPNRPNYKLWEKLKDYMTHDEYEEYIDMIIAEQKSKNTKKYAFDINDNLVEINDE